MDKRKARGVITFLSDFGHSDWYVAAVKGVILSRCPSCRLVDISHDVPPGDILSGAYVLMNAYSHFPAGTVHLAVVDPGVGGSRRPIVVESSGHWFVGPDNGLFGAILEGEPDGVVRVIRRRDLLLDSLSATFHGRDIFAPVAAFIASGGAPEDTGPVIRDWIPLNMPKPRHVEGRVHGLVVFIDRFGNGITNIRMENLPHQWGAGHVEIDVDGHRLEGIRRSYVEVEEGEPVALIGSSGFLEISVNGGSAQEAFGLKPGEAAVTIQETKRGLKADQ